MKAKLKPCPFCGQPARIDECDDYRVVCENEDECGAMVYNFHVLSNAVKAWNRRVEVEK